MAPETPTMHQLANWTTCSLQMWRDEIVTEMVEAVRPKLKWERPRAAFLRATDDQRWEAYRKVALAELDVMFPTAGAAC